MRERFGLLAKRAMGVSRTYASSDSNRADWPFRARLLFSCPEEPRTGDGPKGAYRWIRRKKTTTAGLGIGLVHGLGNDPETAQRVQPHSESDLVAAMGHAERDRRPRSGRGALAIRPFGGGRVPGFGGRATPGQPGARAGSPAELPTAGSPPLAALLVLARGQRQRSSRRRRRASRRPRGRRRRAGDGALSLRPPHRREDRRGAPVASSKRTR